MKITFEGSSGIGKTTLCASLKPDFAIVPEVNLLFGKQQTDDPYWYYQKQVARYHYDKHSKNVIFDGDLFQPLWYNWTYNFPAGYFSLSEMKQFYLEQIREKRIAFPDLYIVFFTSEENLRARKARDKTRKRRNFEKHLKLIKPQSRYFKNLQNCFPALVEFVEYSNLENAKKTFFELFEKSRPGNDYDDEDILIKAVEWLASNRADEI